MISVGGLLRRGASMVTVFPKNPGINGNGDLINLFWSKHVDEVFLVRPAYAVRMEYEGFRTTQVSDPVQGARSKMFKEFREQLILNYSEYADTKYERNCSIVMSRYTKDGQVLEMKLEARRAGEKVALSDSQLKRARNILDSARAKFEELNG